MRSSGFDIYCEILNAVIADHFCFANLLQPRRSGFQHAPRVNAD